MFRLNKGAGGVTDLADMIGAVIVVIKLIGALVNFIEQLPANKKDRVAELEARLAKIEVALEANPVATP